jgi:hypothetical protein
MHASSRVALRPIAFTYDAGGSARVSSDANHSLSWAYDALGCVTSKS